MTKAILTFIGSAAAIGAIKVLGSKANGSVGSVRGPEVGNDDWGKGYPGLYYK